MNLQEVTRAANIITKAEVQQLKSLAAPPISIRKICGMSSDLLNGGLGNNDFS